MILRTQFEKIYLDVARNFQGFHAIAETTHDTYTPRIVPDVKKYGLNPGTIYSGIAFLIAQFNHSSVVKVESLGF